MDPRGPEGVVSGGRRADSRGRGPRGPEWGRTGSTGCGRQAAGTGPAGAGSRRSRRTDGPARSLRGEGGGPSGWSLEPAAGRLPPPESWGSSCRRPCPPVPPRSLGNWPASTPLSRGKALGPPPRPTRVLLRSQPACGPLHPCRPPARPRPQLPGPRPADSGGPGLCPYTRGVWSGGGGRQPPAGAPDQSLSQLFRDALGFQPPGLAPTAADGPQLPSSRPQTSRGRRKGTAVRSPGPAEGRRELLAAADLCPVPTA